MTESRAFAWIVGLVAVGSAWGTRPEPIAPGAKAPAWQQLPGVDGKEHSLADLKSQKVVVVAFTCNSCPYAKAYEDRFIAFAKEFSGKGVAFVAINVNTQDEDRMPKMKERAAEKEFPFAYLFDASQQIGRDYGAKVTPHLFVLDRARNVAYVGAFDNARRVERVTEHYVRDAVSALLAGQQPKIAKTSAAGCSIRYE